MKLKTCILILLIIFTPSVLLSEEFRGLEWGIDIEEIINFRFDFMLLSRSGNLRSYTRRGEQKEIERTPIQSVQYIFYKNKFCGSIITFRGGERFRDLRSAFFNKYGRLKRLDRPSSEEYEYFWKLGEVSIELKYLGIQDEGRINYFYIPLMGQVSKELKSGY